MAYRKNPNIKAELRRNLHGVLEAAAKGAAEQLELNLTGDVGRTGVERDGITSSAENEDPAERSGSLRDSVGYVQTGPLTFVIGTGVAQREDIGKQLALEFGTVDGRIAPRAFLLRAFNSPITHKRMNDEIKSR